MDSKLEAVLVRLCSRLGSLGRTQACKLPYLVDVVAERVLGHRITEATHETWDYGVVTKEAWNATDPRCPNERFAVETYCGTYAGYEIRLADPATRQTCLSDKEIEIVEYVAREFGRKTAGALGELTKSMNPGIADDEWGMSIDADTSQDAYIRLLSPSWINLWAKRNEIDPEDDRSWGTAIEDPADYFEKALRG